jgi:hypothetical protein
MATTSTSTAVALVEPVFTQPERLALAGFLAGYTGLTREAYALDLRQYASWCQQRHLLLFQARRADIECFARDGPVFLAADGRRLDRHGAARIVHRAAAGDANVPGIVGRPARNSPANCRERR